MKHYRDFFGKKITKQDVVQAVIYTVRSGSPYASVVQRHMQIGFFKANRLVRLLADAGVTSPMEATTRKVLLKEPAAINAALRQLKKGQK